MRLILLTLSALLCLVENSLADLRLNPLFSDHAVLQQDSAVPVWGTAEPDEKVTVQFGSQTKTAEAGKQGRWMVVLDHLATNRDGEELVVSSGEEKLVVKDILVGEVWVGSGQSNMGQTVNRSSDFEAMMKEIEAGNAPNVRLFKVPVNGADEPAETVRAAWALPDQQAVSSFSATAYYFARKLARDRKIPVGIIQSANGGTNANSWINSDTLKNDEIAQTTRDLYAQSLAVYPAAKKRYEKALQTWKEKKEAARKSGAKFADRSPRPPMGPDSVKRPAGHYNAMVAPLQPYAIRGVVWYQGEANSRMPHYPEYKDLMLALVEDWRADWADSSRGLVPRNDFPFYLVQLPNFAGGDAEGWPRIREQMHDFWKEGKNTGMVVTLDVGDPNDIHPTNKRPVGERLAGFARANTYGEDIVYSGPVFTGLKIDGNRAIVSFDHSGGGLASLDGEALKYFQVAHEKGKFFPATAQISGSDVIVTSSEVTEPRAVRYAWSNNPENPNFGNKEKLPAAPFRTDNWEE